MDIGALNNYGISTVVNATTEVACHWPKRLRYLRVPVHDDIQEDLYSHLQAAAAFIEETRQNGGKVLVHCLAGRCRSATIVIAYCMIMMRMPLSAAIEQVQRAKEDIRPNHAFALQLLRLERNVWGKCSMKLENYRLVPL